MIQLRLLSGQACGSAFRAHRLPCLVGRSQQADLRLEDAGVFERHLQIELAANEGVVLTVLPDARVAVNGQSVNRALLRNGDIIDAGSGRMQFWLDQTRQHSLTFREQSTWVALGLLCAGQIAIIYRLLQ